MNKVRHLDVVRNPVPVFDFVLFGAGGDLASRKLFPALLRRDAEGVLPAEGRIIAVGRRPMSTDEFRQDLATKLRGAREEIHRFLRRISYSAIDFENPDAMGELARDLTDPGRVRAFYLSIPPRYYAPVCRALAQHRLVTPLSRIVIEKPIGFGLSSARDIMDEVASVFDESATYRIDHYLGKETVQNLLVLRQANTIFERLWSNRDVDHIQITCAEEVGLEDRAGYYDSSGALRDMMQNHVLQLLCLVAMEPPNSLGANAIRDEKLRVLRALQPIEGADVLSRTVRGQYGAGTIRGAPVLGYQDELGQPSETETFVALRVDLQTWRWAGVPIFLRTGKRMAGRFSEIVVTFKPVPHSIFGSLGADGRLEPNKLIIRLQPDEGVQLFTMSKIPGSGRLRLRRTALDLRFGDAFQETPPDAYERLITDVLRGDPTLFMRRDEVEAAWSFVDPIASGWQAHYRHAHRYPAGANGPAQAFSLIAHENRNWHDH